MPIYEYQCGECGHKLEAIQRFSDPLLTQCPACGQQALRKLLSPAGFQLKGTGWYVTDFRDGGKKKEKQENKQKPKDESNTSSEGKPEKREKKTVAGSDD